MERMGDSLYLRSMNKGGYSKWPVGLLMVLFISIVGCKSQTDLERRHAKVMEIHDEVMPLMADMSRKRRQLEKDLPQRDSSEIDQIKETIYLLQSSEKGMWDWMADYTKPTVMNEETIEYFNQQEEAIQKVSTDMKNALDRANQIPDL